MKNILLLRNFTLLIAFNTIMIIRVKLSIIILLFAVLSGYSESHTNVFHVDSLSSLHIGLDSYDQDAENTKDLRSIEHGGPSAIDFGAYFYSDFGGVMGTDWSKGFYIGNMDMAFSLDTEKAGLWNRGAIFFYIFSHHGHHPSQNILHDIQGFSNIETSYTTRVLEFYYEHNFETITVLAGHHDLNSNMARSEFAYPFVNTSFQIQPDISLNGQASTLTSSGLGLSFLSSWSDWYSLKAAVFQGNAGDVHSNPHGFTYSIKGEDGFYAVCEADIFPDYSFLNNIKAGYWYHSSSFAPEGMELQDDMGLRGVYLIADFPVWMFGENETRRGLGGFVKLGYSPSRWSLIRASQSLGFSYLGLLKNDGTDFLGLGFSRVQTNTFMDAAQLSETILELTYKVKVHPNLSIQPDLQYVINPGAISNNADAYIGLLRVIGHF